MVKFHNVLNFGIICMVSQSHGFLFEKYFIKLFYQPPLGTDIDTLTAYYYVSDSNNNMVLSEPIWQAKRDHGNRWLFGQFNFYGQNSTIKNIIFEGKVGNYYLG
jgi:hypothetical protein